MQKQIKTVFSVRHLTYMGVLVALQFILTRFLGIPFILEKRISFAYLPVVFAALTMGPIPAAMVNGVADVLGALLVPQGGSIHPGFTFTAIVGGLIYGVILYRKNVKWYHLVLARLITILICQWGLNTLWLTTLLGKGFFPLLATRIIPDLAQFPIDVFLLYFLFTFFKRLPASLRP
ncbi:MAG: folate family ECF transporter S component [Clostridiales bacterium]|nr:folate family ECF transporter S component [Clostridiales bacterium]